MRKICMLIIFLLLFNIMFAQQKEFIVIKGTEEILNKVQQGGFVIYLRHGKTDTSQRDSYPVDLSDCSKQRRLSQAGRDELSILGASIKKAKIPIGEIFSSPMCRAKESTKILFGDSFTIDKNLLYPAQLTSDEKKPTIKRTLELLSKPLENNKLNRFIIAHAPNLADLMNYFPEREASFIVFKPLGDNNYEYIATFLPDELIELSKSIK